MIDADKEIDRKWMETDRNHKTIIISNENYHEPMGYIVEVIGAEVYTTFWTEEDEKNVIYNSLDSLYKESKIFVNSALINFSPLHQIKYKMMCDFIQHCETNIVRKQASAHN
jgi:hypothetical protein